MKNNRGSILLLCFYVISSFLMVAASFSVLMLNQKLATEHHRQSLQAFYLAEAGLEKAIYELRQDFASSADWRDSLINGVSVVPVENEYYELIPSVNMGTGSYSVLIKNEATADKVWIKSTGVVRGDRSVIQAYVNVSNAVGPVLGVIGFKKL